MTAGHSFIPTVDALEAALTPRTKAVLINNPGNPTGAVFSAIEVDEVLRFARAHDLYVISDEVYSKIVFEPPYTSAWGRGEDDRVIVADSLSKTYSMTGWRIGWALAAADMAAQIAKLQEAYISCCSAVSQKAAEAALSGRPAVRRDGPGGVSSQPGDRDGGAGRSRHRLRARCRELLSLGGRGR